MWCIRVLREKSRYVVPLEGTSPVYNIVALDRCNYSPLPAPQGDIPRKVCIPSVRGLPIAIIRLTSRLLVIIGMQLLDPDYETEVSRNV